MKLSPEIDDYSFDRHAAQIERTDMQLATMLAIHHVLSLVERTSWPGKTRVMASLCVLQCHA